MTAMAIPATKRCSLRARLLRALLIPLGLSFVVVGALSFFLAIRETRALDDAQLISHAGVIRALLDHELREDEPGELDLVIDPTPQGYRYERDFAYRVWLKGVLILSSPNSSAFPTEPGAAGFRNASVDGKMWRFFTKSDESIGVVTEVSEPAALRIQQGLQLLAGTIGPQLLLIPALFVAASVGVGIGLAPIRKLSQQVSQRSAQELSPIESDIIPSEIDPLISAFNDLLSRIDRAMRNERSFTDNAAHELRTPLAAIKAQAQIAAVTTDPDERAILLRDMAQSVDRSAYIIEQMLGLARLDEASRGTQDFDLSAVVQDIVSHLTERARLRGLQLDASITPRMTLRGDADTATILVRNLIENAVKYTPALGQVRVMLIQGPSGPSLEVSDTGPGIPDDQKQRVFDRFVRLGRSDQPGAGLGLAIARRAAELLGGQISLSDAKPSGLIVRVNFDPQVCGNS
jgi:two-component system, OmpR family, sensor histidine kinase QseC